MQPALTSLKLIHVVSPLFLPILCQAPPVGNKVGNPKRFRPLPTADLGKGTQTRPTTVPHNSSALCSASSGPDQTLPANHTEGAPVPPHSSPYLFETCYACASVDVVLYALETRYTLMMSTASGSRPGPVDGV